MRPVVQKRIRSTKFSRRCSDGHRFRLHVLTHYEDVLTRLFTARFPQVVRQNAPSNSCDCNMAALHRWRFLHAGLSRQVKRVRSPANHWSNDWISRTSFVSVLVWKRIPHGQRQVAGLVPGNRRLAQPFVGPVHNFYVSGGLWIHLLSCRSSNRWKPG